MHLNQKAISVAFVLFMALNMLSALAADHQLEATLAREMMAKKQWEYASFQWRKILVDEPDNFDANLGLGETLTNSGFAAEAVTILTNLKDKHPKPDVFYALAKAQMERKDYPAVRDVYLSILEKQPFELRAIQGLKDVLGFLPEEDVNRIKAQIQSISDQAKAKGEESIKGNKFDAASKYYAIAAANSDKTSIKNDYGLSLILAGDSQRGFDEFNNLSKKNKIVVWQVSSNASLSLLSVGKTFAARKQMEKAIKLCKDPKYKAKLYNNLGYIYELSKRRTDAKYSYQHAIELDPTFTKSQLNLAYVEQKEREFEESVNVYKDILKREPKNSDVWTKLGFAYELLYKPKLAISAYQKAIELDPKNKEAYFNLGTLYKKMDKVKLSNDIYKKLMDQGFKEIEESSAAAAETPSLLKYVDVFFSNQTLLDKNS